MERRSGTLTAENRDRLREKARREWADPEIRARRLDAMQKIRPDVRQAILTACQAHPRQLYKTIAQDFGVSLSAVSLIMREAGLRRFRPRRKPTLFLRPQLQAAE